jgi:RND family efflux transporter MFP subunit
MDRPARPRRALRRVLGLTLSAVALVGAGLIGGVVWSNRTASSPKGATPVGQSTAPARTPRPSLPASAETSAAGDEPAQVTLTPDTVARAGIRTAAVESHAALERITVPATVASDAYRDTRVNALVGGVVTRVPAELGSRLHRGDALAVIFSNDLAEAQTRYLSMQAMLEADHRKVERTQKLEAIGAASRQELEEVTAVHAGHETEVAASRQRLLLLGLSPVRVAALKEASQVVSDVVVPSPVEGVVITRTVNPGQVVSAGQDLFVVADLRTVWVIGDLYEKDFSSVRIGTPATVTVPAAAQNVLRGRVAYIDPRVDPATRTAKVRVEVPNRTGDLRLGMYVNVSFEEGGNRQRIVIPQQALQTVGGQSVVYVPSSEGEGQFEERRVKLGATLGDRVEVLEGLKPGEQIVTEGSFFLRAEATRARSGS